MLDRVDHRIYMTGLDGRTLRLDIEVSEDEPTVFEGSHGTIVKPSPGPQFRAEIYDDATDAPVMMGVTNWTIEQHADGSGRVLINDEVWGTTGVVMTRTAKTVSDVGAQNRVTHLLEQIENAHRIMSDYSTESRSDGDPEMAAAAAAMAGNLGVLGTYLNRKMMAGELRTMDLEAAERAYTRWMHRINELAE